MRDFMYLYGKGERPTLVTFERESGKVWSYALRDKSVLGGDGRIQRRVALEICNAGHKDVKITVKSDHEASRCITTSDTKRRFPKQSSPL